MGSRTYKTRALVLKKTKLREKDLIVTMLDSEGALVRGVAKGARRPGGSLAARLELFSEVDALMASGRSLEVVCEARLPDPASPPPSGLEQSACAAPVAELLCLVAQPGLAQPRLFELARASFARIAAQTGKARLLALCAAALWKVMAQSGFRPQLAACALCGSPAPGPHAPQATAFSPSDGGFVCAACPRPPDSLPVEAGQLHICDALLASRLDEIIASGLDEPSALSALELARIWIRAHTGRDLKSLGFLFGSGLF